METQAFIDEYQMSILYDEKKYDLKITAEKGSLILSKTKKRRSTNNLLVLLYIGIFFTAISSFFTP